MGKCFKVTKRSKDNIIFFLFRFRRSNPGGKFSGNFYVYYSIANEIRGFPSWKRRDVGTDEDNYIALVL